MRHLWAPWRLTYITGPKTEGCVFCQAIALGDDRTVLVLHRSSHGFLILNRFPYNTGHLMVVPYRHVARLEGLSSEEAEALMALTDFAVRLLEHVMVPQGFNIGMNLGRSAGAGIDDHLHMHVVPRWVGDTNYMPVLGDVKVMPEHLEQTYDRLAAGLAAVPERPRR